MDRQKIKKYIQNCIENEQLEEAQQAIDQYKKIIGYDDEIASMEAIIQIYCGNYTEALSCVRKGLKRNIFNSDLYFTMGNIYELMSKYNNAYLCYEHALTLSSENSEQIIKAVHNLRETHNINVNNYSIVILTYNKLEYTKVCIDSIRKYNGNEGCEIIVVDNNSTDGTREYLKQQNDIKYILNDENKGFPVGCNQGIELADKNNDIFLLNNDTVIMPNSIFNLRMGLYFDEKAGATGSVSNNVANYQRITKTFNDFNEYIDFAQINNVTNYESYERRIKLVGFAMFIKRNVLDKVGLLDERFTPGNFEDDDLSVRIVLAGYDLILCKDSYIHHFGSTSFRDNAEVYNNLLKVNEKKFADKWGYSSTYSSFIRYDIINLMNPVNDNIKVLEVGCGCGATLQMIKNIYRNAELYGIELNENSAKVAGMVADVRSENIEKTNLSYAEKSFDYILLSDVLEKMYNPQDVIIKIKKYLKTNGELLASITNVMNYSVIAGLLNGNWTYSDWGILDKRNIKFFTLNEIQKLFEKAEYKIIDVTGNSNVVNEDESNFINMVMSVSTDKDRSKFEIAQYIIKAKAINKKLETQLKFAFRKIELNVYEEESKKEILNEVRNNKVNVDTIIDIIDKDITDKIYVLNYTAILFYDNSMYDYVIPILNAAYEIDKSNIDTNYNLAYMLSLIGNKELALEYLYNLNTNNERILSLINYIQS